MTYFVYILFSEKDKGLYTGYTDNLKNRIKTHNSGSVRSTKYRCPLVLIYHESLKTKSEALKRESFLKTRWGNTFKQRVKKYYVNKISHVKLHDVRG